MPAVQHARLLVIPVEFNPNANDDFSGFERPDADDPTGCVTEPPGTVLNGPLHNQHPEPRARPGATTTRCGCRTSARPTTTRSSTPRQGITEQVRRPGPATAASTSRGLHGQQLLPGDVQGPLRPRPAASSDWIQVPHSEAWYSARHLRGRRPERLRPPGQPARRRPDGRRRGRRRWPRRSPSFPWADYDVEDQGDVDGDGNLFEPDGVIDHVVVVHAGEDKSDGGGAAGHLRACGRNSSVVDPATGGYAVPRHRLQGLQLHHQPEDAGVGVIAHEFGHDLGLPDLYDSIGATDSDIGFWDIMSSGSHSGPLFQHRCRRTWAPGASTCSAGSNPKVLDYGSRQGVRQARAGEHAAQGHRGRRCA